MEAILVRRYRLTTWSESFIARGPRMSYASSSIVVELLALKSHELIIRSRTYRLNTIFSNRHSAAMVHSTRTAQRRGSRTSNAFQQAHEELEAFLLPAGTTRHHQTVMSTSSVIKEESRLAIRRQDSWRESNLSGDDGKSNASKLDTTKSM